MSTTKFSSGLGLSTGDVFRTDYNTGPFTIGGVTKPHYAEYVVGGFIVRTWPVVSIYGDWGGINYIRRLPDGRYFTDANSEVIVVERHAESFTVQASIFDLPDDVTVGPSPHDFMIDGQVAPAVWSCYEHRNVIAPHHEWPGARKRWHQPYPNIPCPLCGKRASLEMVLELLPRPEPPERPQGNQWNAAILSMNTSAVNARSMAEKVAS